MARVPLVLLLAALGAACTGKRTMLVVEVDSNLMIDSELAAIELQVKRDGVDPPWSERFSVDSAEVLPIRVGIVPADDRRDGLLLVTALGFARGGSAPVAREDAVVSFVRDEARVLQLFLAAECRNRTCGGDLTCTAGGACIAKVRAPSMLGTFDPSARPLTRDAGATVPPMTDAAASSDGGGPDDAPTGGVGGSGGTATGGAGGGTGGSGTGGVAGSGGSPGTGGSSGTGGLAGTGGTVGTGGSVGTGGIIGSGGSVGTGGSPATGGSPGTGGSPATGGSPGTGGSGTGGVGGTGGADPSLPQWTLADCPNCRPLFDGATLAGWTSDPPDSWTVQGGAMASKGLGRGTIYTNQDFAEYRVIFSVKQVMGNHAPCLLFFGTRPPNAPNDALGALQFQMPNGGHWDYRPGKNNSGTGLFTDLGNADGPVTDWNQCEVLVHAATGEARMACCALQGRPRCKGIEVVRFKDPTAGKPGPFAWQMHNSGLFDLYRDVYIDPSATGNELITTH